MKYYRVDIDAGSWVRHYCVMADKLEVYLILLTLLQTQGLVQFVERGI